MMYYLFHWYFRRKGGFIAFLNRTKEKKLLIRKICELISRLYLDKNNSHIGRNSQISSSVIFPHGIRGIFISGDAKIGHNCVIFQQVTIGSNTIPNSKTFGSPKIGHNCYIGAGAKIIGEVTVGDNSRIGANCIVNCDIPDNTLVVLQPPRFIRKTNLDNRHFQRNNNGLWCYYFNNELHFVNGDELEEIRKYDHKGL